MMLSQVGKLIMSLLSAYVLSFRDIPGSISSQVLKRMLIYLHILLFAGKFRNFGNGRRRSRNGGAAYV